MKSAVPALTAVALLISCATFHKSLRDMAASGLDLTYHVRPNTEFTYRVTGTSETTQQMMGQSTTFTNTFHQVFRLRVVSATENEIEYAVRVDSLEIQSAAPMQFDLEGYKKALLSADIRIKTDRKGNVKQVYGIEAVKKHPLGNNVESQMRQLFLQFPAEPRKIGDSWPYKQTSTIASGPLKIQVSEENTYTFAGVEPCAKAECLNFKVKGSITMSGSGSQGDIELVFDGSGTSDGEILFDYGTGTTFKMTSHQIVDGTVSVLSQGMDIPSTTRQTLLIQRIN